MKYKKLNKNISSKKKFFKINKILEHIFNINICSSNESISFLKKRNLYIKKIIYKFKIGYLCKNKFFKIRSKYKKYISCIKNNVRYFLFDKRIIFPIRNIKGNRIGFIGRNIKNDSYSRYIFSNIKKYIKKNEILYGLFENYKYIKKSKFIFIVEGIIDLISMFKIGIKNVISTLGCNISIYQIKTLINTKKNIYFLYDGDKAGRNAYIYITYKYFYLLINKNVFFIFLKYKDPDYLINNNLNYFKKEITNKISLEEFIIENNYFNNVKIINYFINNFSIISRKIKIIKIKNKYFSFYFSILKTKLKYFYI
ncbi:toprim domain-containing protein [Candidatus Vidania fulgoroideorum]